MRTTKYIITSLALAGFGPADPALAGFVQATTGGGDDPDTGKLFQLFKQDHLVTLAQHRSHRSHRSHSSHRSGSGGYSSPVYSAPSPVYVPPSPPPPPPPSSRPRSPSSRPLPWSPPATTEGKDVEAPTPQTLIRPHRVEGLPALSGRTQRFASIVRRVQIALLGRGLYEGTIDGVVGPGTRAAIRNFQTGAGLEATGTITPEVLDGLMVSSE